MLALTALAFLTLGRADSPVNSKGSDTPDPILGTLIYPQKYWGLATRYEPSLGFYDSLDEEILDQQITWMRHAGIDFALWQWRPDDGHNDAVIDLYRGRPGAIPWAVQYESKMDMDPVSQWRDIDFTEVVPDGTGEVRGDRFVRRMNELIHKGWAGSEGYFTVNNRPVVYLWAFTYWRNWAPYVDRVFADYRERGLEPPYFIGVIDGWATPETEPFGFQHAWGRIAAFNAPIMVNNDEKLMADYYGNVRAAWQRWKDAAESIGSVLIPTVAAGFDYTAVIAGSAVLPREGGDTLRRHYELARELTNKDTPLVLNKSWNDFPEGDSVEPAVEYGTLYIDILRSLAGPILGAYYYLWYGQEGRWGQGTAHTPLLGRYDSRDPNVISQHSTWARQASVDFMATGWTGPGTFEDEALQSYLATEGHVPFVVHYESAIALAKEADRAIDFDDDVLETKRGELFLGHMQYLLNEYLSRPDYYRVNGRPILIFYLVRDWDNWTGYMARFKEMARDLAPYLVADVVWWDRNPSPSDWRELSLHFEAITGYNLYDPSRPEEMQAYWEHVEEFWARWQQAARNHGLAFVPTVMAGYDDRNLRGQGRPVLERQDGDIYRAAWETAKQFVDEDVPLVLLASFNEWHEGTEIEPSIQYGETYLSLTSRSIAALPGSRLRDSQERRIPRLPPVTYLYVVDGNALSSAEQVMVQGLQGILAQQAGGQDIWFATNHRYDRWLDDLERDYGVQVDFSLQDDPWALIDRFKQQVNGYILFTLNEDSENVATSLAGVMRALPVEEQLEPRAREHGLTLALDVRGKDEKWVLEQYWPSLNHDLVFHQIENIHCCLRDYAVATRGLMFYDGDSEFFRDVLHSVNEGGIVFGWGRDDFSGEDRFVLPATQAGLITVPTDLAQNLSILSTFDLGPLRQKTPSPELQAEEKVHYVTFVMSDGDNLQWLLSDFAFDERWYGSPLRGQFPMGWTVSPMMAELAPTVLKRLYGDASDGDFFIAGVSGRGYFYPSQLPDLEAEADRTNNAMSLAGLDIAYIVDTESGAFSSNVLANYAVQPNIAGGFWLYYPDNAAKGGSIVFSHDKPFISVTHNLWEGLDSPESIAAKINAAPRDPHSPAGYSVVNVHAWSMDLSDVAATIAALDADVRVVTPSDLIRLVAQNVSPASVEDCPFSLTGALVISSEAAPEIRDVAMACRDIYGERVQVTSGFNDHVEIQAAIESLPDGGRVVLSEGRFQGGQVVLKSGISLEGQGPSTVYRLADGANTSAILGQSPTGYAGLQNVTIRALTIDGNRAGHSSTSHGIHISNALDITITDVHVQGVRDSAILLEDTQRAQVRTNNIKSSGHGITVQDAIYGQNLVEGNVLYGISGNAIQVLAETKECVDNNFNDNIIREARNGFFIQGVGHTAGGNNYSGNRILFVEEAAFHIGEWGSGSSITGSYVNDARWGVWSAPGSGHNLVSSNWFTFIRREAVLLQGDYNTVVSNGIDVAGTDAHNTYDAISVAGRRNLVQGNHVTQSAGGNTYRYGIGETGDADYNLFIGNRIQQAATGAARIIGPNSRIWDGVPASGASEPASHSTKVPWYLWLALGVLGVGVIGAITMSWTAMRRRVERG